MTTFLYMVIIVAMTVYNIKLFNNIFKSHFLEGKYETYSFYYS